MNNDMQERNPDGAESIAAISTAPGIGAVAIVRLSGPRAWEIGRSLARNPERFDSLQERITRVMSLVHPRTAIPLDYALIVKHKAPESFTGEDVVEFQCHGGYTVPEAVLGAVKAAGARQALPGEFTQRAFLNGRLDLAGAEAVDLLIRSRSEAGRLLALSGLNGELGREINNLREELIELKATLEYDLDFPEEEPLNDLKKRVTDSLYRVGISLRKLLEGAERNLLISRGALVVIAGAPNSGKSSLFNALAGQDRSIVTATAGTTRDAVECEIQLGGMLFRLVDTAGLRKGRSEAERIGVEFSRKYISKADIVIFLHEAGSKVKAEEAKFLETRPESKVVRLLSKSDLLSDKKTIPEEFIPVSVKREGGLEELKSELIKHIIPGDGKTFFDHTGPQIASQRQKSLIEDALKNLERIEPGQPTELIAASLEEVCSILGEVTGVIQGEEILDRIFCRFCVGK